MKPSGVVLMDNESFSYHRDSIIQSTCQFKDTIVMPSVQARVFNLIVRLIVKRKNWGGPQRLTRRARKIFGAPRISQWLATRDMIVTPVNENGLRGEWLERKAGHDSSIVLYIHGGGFVSCSPATHRPISAALARTTHFRVFCVDYRLAPEHPFPMATVGPNISRRAHSVRRRLSRRRTRPEHDHEDPR
jgi:acetyl esterase/lipase